MSTSPSHLLLLYIYEYFNYVSMLTKVCDIGILRFQLYQSFIQHIVSSGGHTSSNHRDTIIQPDFFHDFDKAKGGVCTVSLAINR
jgi:hypothetical protein